MCVKINMLYGVNTTSEEMMSWWVNLKKSNRNYAKLNPERKKEQQKYEHGINEP